MTMLGGNYSTTCQAVMLLSRFGEALMERREVAGYAKQGEAASASSKLADEYPERFQAFSQQWLSRLEADTTGEAIRKAQPMKLLALAYLLKLDSGEFYERIGVAIAPVPLRENVGASQRTSPGFDPKPFPGARLLHYGGTVGAGLHMQAGATDYLESRFVPNHPAIEGYDDDDLLILDVVGDSMACEEVRKTIPEDSTVYLHKHLEPQPGDIVAVWLEQKNTGVLKIYRRVEKHIILQSYNDEYAPIVLSESDRDILQGVYLGHLTMGRRALNLKPKVKVRS